LRVERVEGVDDREDAPSEALAGTVRQTNSTHAHEHHTPNTDETEKEGEEEAIIRESVVEITIESVQSQPMQIAVLEVVPKSLGKLEDNSAEGGVAPQADASLVAEAGDSTPLQQRETPVLLLHAAAFSARTWERLGASQQEVCMRVRRSAGPWGWRRASRWD
jgi:hypothetical protein